MTRREFREHVVKLVYLSGFHDAGELEEQFRLYADLQEVGGEGLEEIKDRFLAIAAKAAELDEELGAVSTGWKVDRMGKVELAIMRVALYELRFCPDIPQKVSLNEAIEIAKIYCRDESPAFINGVLAKLVAKEG